MTEKAAVSKASIYYLSVTALFIALTYVFEDSKAALNEELVWLFHQEIPPEAAFTYFVPDSKKAGGEYITITGRISKYDEFSQSITLENGKVLFIEDISKIECDAFDELMW